MNQNPTLKNITIYPVKSLDGVSLQKATISEGGCLLHDREFAICDESGNFINGKSNPLVHTLRSKIDLESETISLKHQHESVWNKFNLKTNDKDLLDFLSQYFSTKVQLIKDSTGRFLDVPDHAGVTIISTSSLQAVSAWFNQISLDEVRKRFRVSLELDGVPAFWEDHLFTSGDQSVAFKIGEVNIMGIKPCERCVVPTRNPETGEVIHAFPKLFAKKRLENQPIASTLSSYGHGYFLSVNCMISASEIGKTLKIGDRVTIL